MGDNIRRKVIDYTEVIAEIQQRTPARTAG
jgi:hypothetical protein